MTVNVTQLPTALDRAVQRAQTAMATYAKHQHGTLSAVLDYAKALQEGRNLHKSNKAFGRWVVENELNVGDPWNDASERSKAMQLVSILGNLPKIDLTECPNTRPSNIMKWLRVEYSEAFEPKDPRPERPRKNKAEPRKPEAAPETPQTDAAYAKIVEWKTAGREIPGKKEFAKLIGISHMAVEKAWDRWRQDQEREADAKAKEDALLVTSEEKFSGKSKLTIADAIRIHTARLDKAFEQKVAVEVRRHIDAADDTTRKDNSRLRKENMQLTMLLQQKMLFTADEFKTIMRCLHPDNSASAEVRARAFDLFVKKEQRLIGRI